MGRPKKDPDDLQGDVLRIPLKPDQKEEVRRLAKLDGETMTNWARQAVLQAVRRRVESEARKRKR